ncbi:YacL family protein [Vibrio sp.]|uniref:UPF0231 family protein n=1 Tax=Vibrio sp. TaxID=678 RepID=UPI003D0DE6C3
MEFEFIRISLTGEFRVKCSMGHEVVARWLEEEIALDTAKLDRLEAMIAAAKSVLASSQQLLGTEYSMQINADEVLVQANAMALDSEESLEEDWQLYDSESIASCGLEDFQALISQWREFVNR